LSTFYFKHYFKILFKNRDLEKIKERTFLTLFHKDGSAFFYLRNDLIQKIEVS